MLPMLIEHIDTFIGVDVTFGGILAALAGTAMQEWKSTREDRWWCAFVLATIAAMVLLVAPVSVVVLSKPTAASVLYAGYVLGTFWTIAALVWVLSGGAQ
jgi:uncharacterized membrane protein YeaQ/YmgE (transglycosylase-associated protein family)